MHIRPYSPADKDRLLDIWLAASRVGHPFIAEDELRQQQRIVGDIYLSQADNWVAELDGLPVGFIGLLDNFIGGLFVDPKMHGSGIGRSLVEHAAGRLGKLTVTVYADNQKGVGFYRRCGFEEISRADKDDEGRPLAVVEMRRAGKAIQP
jgi:ribosomal protein S18 acetylase RimI-like enzyme